MDIQRACGVLATAEKQLHLKYFSEQYQHYGMNESTPLKDFFDVIQGDTLKWLQSLPPNAKSKETYRKYKSALNALLENNEVNEILGKDYCSRVHRKLKKDFNDLVDKVVDGRKIEGCSVDPKQNTDIENKPVCDSEDDEETDDKLDISLLEPVDNEYDHKHEGVDYKKLYEELTIKHRVIVEQLQKENNRLWELAFKFATK